MRALVTGAHGFVGGTLTRALVAQGADVCALVRRDASGEPDSPVKARSADLADPNSIAAAARTCDVIFHCAALTSPRAPSALIEQVNVSGTENVVAAARYVGVKRVVVVSCADVTLTGRHRLHVCESAALGQLPLGTIARTKLLAEELALVASTPACVITALRPAWLWGPGEQTNTNMLCEEANNGGVRLFGDGGQLFATLYIDNFIAALLAAASAPGIGGLSLHITDAETVTAREFFEPWCRALGLAAPRPGFFPAAYAAAIARKRFGLKGPWPEDVARRGRSSLLDGERAHRLLGYQPKVAMEAGFAALSAWARKRGQPIATPELANHPRTGVELAPFDNAPEPQTRL